MTTDPSTNPAPEAVEEPESNDQATGEATSTDDAESTSTANREAAAYRRRLREAEGERDDLNSRVEVLQRAEVDRIASDHRLKPEALWAAGTQLGDLLDEHGAVDAEKVKQAVETAADDLGVRRPPGSLYVGGEGRMPAHTPRDSWGDAFKPNR